MINSVTITGCCEVLGEYKFQLRNKGKSYIEKNQDGHTSTSLGASHLSAVMDYISLGESTQGVFEITSSGWAALACVLESGSLGDVHQKYLVMWL